MRDLSTIDLLAQYHRSSTGGQLYADAHRELLRRLGEQVLFEHHSLASALRENEDLRAHLAERQQRIDGLKGRIDDLERSHKPRRIMVDPSQLSNQDLVEAALGYDNASAHADELRQELLRRLRPYIELTPQPERQSRGQAQLEQLREAVTRPTNMSDLLRGLLTIAELLHEQNEITRGSME